MVSTTEVDGDKPNIQATWKNKRKSENKNLNFAGAAKSDSVLYQKVITSGTNQDGQLLSLVETLPSYIGIKGYTDWAESIRGMERKDKDDFMPIVVRKRDYGTVNNAGIFEWHADALDTEDEYNRDYKIWDRNVTAGIKQWKDYVNNGRYLFLALQGQVEPSLWDKTKDDVRLASVQALKCPIALINLMKDRSTGP